MSIFQNTYFIVPRKGNYDLFEGLNLKSFLEEDFFDDDLFWNNLNLKLENLEENLLKNFDEGISWSKDLKIYGSNEDNCLEIIIENTFIASVSFRINFSTDFSEFLCNVIKLCEANDFLVVDNSLNILPLDYQIINDNVFSSDAYLNYKKFYQASKENESE